MICLVNCMLFQDAVGVSFSSFCNEFLVVLAHLSAFGWLEHCLVGRGLAGGWAPGGGQEEPTTRLRAAHTFAEFPAHGGKQEASSPSFMSSHFPCSISAGISSTVRLDHKQSFHVCFDAAVLPVQRATGNRGNVDTVPRRVCHGRVHSLITYTLMWDVLFRQKRVPDCTVLRKGQCSPSATVHPNHAMGL